MHSVSKKKNLLILMQLLCLAALVAVTVHSRQQDKAQILSRSLLSPALANHIEIHNSQQQIKLEKNADGWQLTAPLQQPANQQRVQPLLSLLTLPNSHRYLESDVKLAELGLEPAQATVRINQLVFRFGQADVSGKKRYLLSAGGVYLIDDILFPLINTTAQTFAAADTR